MNMQKELERTLKIEADLIPSFQRVQLTYQNTTKEKIQEKSSYLLQEANEKEQSDLKLFAYTNEELKRFIKVFPDFDFSTTFFQIEKYDPIYRLYYNLQKEQIQRLKEKSNQIELRESEKMAYYNILFHFRTMESYFLCNLEQPYESHTWYYQNLFYNLWYMTPGIEILTDVLVTIPYWTSGKNISKKEYYSIERQYLNGFFEYFLGTFQNTKESEWQEMLAKDSILSFFYTYFRLAFAHFSFEEVKNLVSNVLKEKNSFLEVLEKFYQNVPRDILVKTPKF